LTEYEAYNNNFLNKFSIESPQISAQLLEVIFVLRFSQIQFASLIAGARLRSQWFCEPSKTIRNFASQFSTNEVKIDYALQ